MIEYQLILASSPIKLQDMVNMYLSNGWKPQGGISTTQSYYAQAVVREIEDAH